LLLIFHLAHRSGTNDKKAGTGTYSRLETGWLEKKRKNENEQDEERIGRAKACELVGEAQTDEQGEQKLHGQGKARPPLTAAHPGSVQPPRERRAPSRATVTWADKRPRCHRPPFLLRSPAAPAERGAARSGMSLGAAGLGCAPSQLLVPPARSLAGRGETQRPWRWASPAQREPRHGGVGTAGVVTDPDPSTVPATVKKVHLIPAKPSTHIPG